MQNTTLTLKIERAISELRRGGKIVISDPNSGSSVLLMASELIQENTIQEFSERALSRPNIILSSNRCNAIGIQITNQSCSVLIDKSSKKSNEFWSGRTSENNVVVFPKYEFSLGEIVNVQVNDCTTATLIGDIIKVKA